MSVWLHNASLAEINLFPGRFYGVLQVFSGLALLLTVCQPLRADFGFS